MNALEELARTPLWGELGLVLLHFLWQGTLVAALAALFLRALQQRSAAERYAVGCVALFAMLALPAGTWFWLGRGAPEQVHSAIDVITAAATQQPAPAELGWLAVLGILWLAGALLQQLRLLVCTLRAGRLRRRDALPASRRLQAVADELAERLGLKRGVRLYRSSLAQVPLIVGWLEPVVLVPASALASLSPAELRAVLAHELAHLRRLDHLVNALQVLLETVLFFHPAVWWLSARVREEREYCCDDLAVEVCGDPLCYARALTSLEAMRNEASALVLSSNGGSLMHRIRRLVAGEGFSMNARPTLATPALFATLALGLVSGSAWGLAPAPQDCGLEGCPQHRTERVVVRRAAPDDDLDQLRARVAELRARLTELESRLAGRQGQVAPHPPHGIAGDGKAGAGVFGLLSAPHATTEGGGGPQAGPFGLLTAPHAITEGDTPRRLIYRVHAEDFTGDEQHNEVYDRALRRYTDLTEGELPHGYYRIHGGEPAGEGERYQFRVEAPRDTTQHRADEVPYGILDMFRVGEAPRGDDAHRDLIDALRLNPHSAPRAVIRDGRAQALDRLRLDDFTREHDGARRVYRVRLQEDAGGAGEPGVRVLRLKRSGDEVLRLIDEGEGSQAVQIPDGLHILHLREEALKGLEGQAGKKIIELHGDH